MYFSRPETISLSAIESYYIRGAKSPADNILRRRAWAELAAWIVFSPVLAAALLFSLSVVFSDTARARPAVAGQSAGAEAASAFAAAASSAPLAAPVSAPSPYPGDTPRLIISRIGVDTPIVIPQSPDFEVLNAGLEKGAVYYPGSSLPGEDGNMFLFGHSTRLKEVRNKFYQVFNRLKELEEGDVILIQWGDRQYQYRVRSVSVKRAADTQISFQSDAPKLTLSTCRLLGPDIKEFRYVVDAEFIGTNAAPTKFPLVET